MKFTVNQADILDVLSKVQGLTGRKSNLAITSNILIQTNETGISITATDLETGYEGRHSAHVEDEGAIAVDARKFYEIIKDFPSTEICVEEVDNRWIEIRGQGIEYQIMGMNTDDFPESPSTEDAELFAISSGAFKDMIEKSVFITGDPKDRRAHINGVYFEETATADGACLRLVSTDGRRLATVDHSFDAAAKIPSFVSALVPKKGLVELNKFLEKEGTVHIGFLNNQFIIRKENETIIIRLLEGDFPEYKEILEERGEYVIKFDRNLFLMMLRRMSILSTEDYRAVIFHFDDDKLMVTATNPELGQSKEEMLINFQGEKIEVAFNPKYFLETLNVLESEKISLNVKDPNNACFVQGEDEKNFLSVIMPMRI